MCVCVQCKGEKRNNKWYRKFANDRKPTAKLAKERDDKSKTKIIRIHLSISQAKAMPSKTNFD